MAPKKGLGKFKKNEKQLSSLSLQIAQQDKEIKLLTNKLAYKKAKKAKLNDNLAEIDCPEKQPPVTI